MVHAQKPDFLLRRNGRVHLNRLGRQFSRLLAAEMCASTWVMLDKSCYEVVWEHWLPTPFASFPFTSPPVRHSVPSGSERAVPYNLSVPKHNKSADTNCIWNAVSVYITRHNQNLVTFLYVLVVQLFTLQWISNLLFQSWCTSFYHFIKLFIKPFIHFKILSLV